VGRYGRGRAGELLLTAANTTGREVRVTTRREVMIEDVEGELVFAPLEVKFLKARRAP